jgi:hypothetical protein
MGSSRVGLLEFAPLKCSKGDVSVSTKRAIRALLSMSGLWWFVFVGGWASAGAMRL